MVTVGAKVNGSTSSIVGSNSVGTTEGGETDGSDDVGDFEGGLAMLGISVSVGSSVVMVLGNLEGKLVGWALDGAVVGSGLGDIEGLEVGTGVGSTVGAKVAIKTLVVSVLADAIGPTTPLDIALASKSELKLALLTIESSISFVLSALIDNTTSIPVAACSPIERDASPEASSSLVTFPAKDAPPRPAATLATLEVGVTIVTGIIILTPTKRLAEVLELNVADSFPNIKLDSLRLENVPT